MTKEEFARRLTNACDAVIQAEAELTEIDSKFGDADHGLTMTKVAKAIAQAVAASDGGIQAMLDDAAMAVMALNGGSAVPLWNTWLDGMQEEAPEGGEIDAVSNPTTLVMLLPVVVMLAVSTKTRNIYAGIGVGLSLGTVVGLAAGLFTFGDVFANDAANSAAVGFLIDGVNSILPTCALVISVFGIMGVLNDAGMLDYLADSILQSKAASTERGAELICMLGISLTTILFGGVTSASILTFGPILNRIGSAKNIHPYRRANLLDGTANSLPAIVPFMSVFVFIGAALTGLSPVEVAGGTVYAFALFGTFLFAVITGWGRKHEDEPAKK